MFQESPDYSFMTCVKTSQAQKVGCRPPWDIWSPASIPVTLEENIAHEKFDWKLLNYEKKIVINSTNCLIPCKFKEYKLVGEPTDGNSKIYGPQGEKG